MLYAISCKFKNRAVLNSTWASGLARAATEALVEVWSDVVLPTKLALRGTANQIDAAPWRVGLFAMGGERGTALQAESATDALGGQVLEVALHGG